jgi:hypothetical protein
VNNLIANVPDISFIDIDMNRDVYSILPLKLYAGKFASYSRTFANIRELPMPKVRVKPMILCLLTSRPRTDPMQLHL